jgi:hypothetical protein
MHCACSCLIRALGQGCGYTSQSTISTLPGCQTITTQQRLGGVRHVRFKATCQQSMSCGGATSSVPVGDWVCSPCAVVVPASPSGSPLHTHRRQRREGPWRSRQGRCTIFLSFFLLPDTACAHWYSSCSACMHVYPVSTVMEQCDPSQVNGFMIFLPATHHASCQMPARM